MNALIKVRKIVSHVENIYHEGGQPRKEAIKKGAILIVLENPYAGDFVDEITPMMDALKPVGLDAAGQLIEMLGGPDKIQSYGKGAIVGIDGEIEHAAALLHPRFGAPVRKAVVSGKDIIPSTKKIGGVGSTIVMPVTNKNNIWNFDNMDAAEITIPDAPKPDEIVIAVCLAMGGRPLKRIKPD